MVSNSWDPMDYSIPGFSVRHYFGVCSNSCPLCWWWYLTISSLCLQSFPALGSFPVSWLFTSGVQSIGVSASVLPMNIQGWFPLGLTGLVFFQFKGLWRLLSKRKLWYIYTMEYYSAIKKIIWISSNEVDDTGAYYTEWSKWERKTPIQCINACIWNLERW